MCGLRKLTYSMEVVNITGTVTGARRRSFSETIRHQVYLF